ncbi:hypothetical protein FB381_1624 [Nocardioides albertanoniae]|uniref:Peptidase inhibitor family I36 n=1 Tax=Nocardioides albertanoniae TaxID=1175486 RepID=A0A543A570_9ACTN|nr:hypothetical protein [Nocardioides albertanoniae]TQL67742.1 hypothetical protein FB381_1624 [Nocardioides albertanoniae]
MNTVITRAAMTGFASVAIAGGALLASAPAAQAEAAKDVTAQAHGCPSGAVCVYPGTGWNGDMPEHVYYSYGAHNLSNEHGDHRVYNNQTGGATARTCTGYDGTGDCEGFLGSGYYVDKNLTAYNSIVLVRP